MWGPDAALEPVIEGAYWSMAALEQSLGRH